MEPVRVVEELRDDGVAVVARRRQDARGTPAVRERVVEVLIGGVGLVAGVGCLVVEEVLERVRVVARGRVATGVDPACREVDVHLPAGLGVVTGVHETVGPAARPLVLSVEQLAALRVDERLVVGVAGDLGPHAPRGAGAVGRRHTTSSPRRVRRGPGPEQRACCRTSLRSRSSIVSARGDRLRARGQRDASHRLGGGHTRWCDRPPGARCDSPPTDQMRPRVSSTTSIDVPCTGSAPCVWR